MRKLQPLKAAQHALRSLVTYRAAALRLGIFWIPLLVAADLIQMWVGIPQPPPAPVGAPHLLQLASAALHVVAGSSLAVSWHRFILRDEPGSPTRLDATVWRYAGNALLITLAAIPPLFVLILGVALLPVAAAILLLPVGFTTGVALMRLSLKLPAVALERRDFTLRHAWAATAGNFWQILGLLLIIAAAIFTPALALELVASQLAKASPTLALFVAIPAGALLKLYLTIFNAGILTSLYGFFVERRDF
jgi:hypothetical protein